MQSSTIPPEGWSRAEREERIGASVSGSKGVMMERKAAAWGPEISCWSLEFVVSWYI